MKGYFSFFCFILSLFFAPPLFGQCELEKDSSRFAIRANLQKMVKNPSITSDSIFSFIEANSTDLLGSYFDVGRYYRDTTLFDESLAAFDKSAKTPGKEWRQGVAYF